jgi:PRC-barrel domain
MHLVGLRPAAAAALLLLAVAGPAQAQQASSTVLREATGEVAVPPFNRSSTELEDMNLLSHTGEEIGEVGKVLVDEDGQPAAITAEVGGFLGVGEKTVVIGFDRLRLEGEDEPDLATTLTREEMQSLQAWAGQ